MRLSTDAARDARRAAAVLDAAVAARLAILDTADAYALDETEIGHNEQLIAAALVRDGSRQAGAQEAGAQGAGAQGAGAQGAAAQGAGAQEAGAQGAGAQGAGAQRAGAQGAGAQGAGAQGAAAQGAGAQGLGARVSGALTGRAPIVASKGGLVRPSGAWVADGRARHLAAAARASRERLGVAAIELYLLHAIDPRTALATSVRALAKLREEGVIRAIGLANVNATQLAEALAIAPIEAVEVELHPWKLDAIRGGLVAACAARGIRVLAHRPLGGPAGVKRAARDPVLVAIGLRLGATPAEVALAWIASLDDGIVPLPGATRVETVASIARAAVLELPADVRSQLAAQFLDVSDAGTSRAGTSTSGTSRAGTSTAATSTTATSTSATSTAASSTSATSTTATSTTTTAASTGIEGEPPAANAPAVLDAVAPLGRAPGPRGVATGAVFADGDRPARELVVLMGMPASGKSTLAAAYVAQGYERLNRDERGGSLLALARAVGRAFAAGATRVVVDNTYPTRASRAPLVEVARRHGARVHGVLVATAIEDAQANAVARLLESHGRLLEPAELAHAKRGAGVLAPSALFRWRREYEPPQPAEGFDRLDELVPARRSRGTHTALVVELDALVWAGRPSRPEDIVLVGGDATARLAHAREDALLAGTTWQPGQSAAGVAALAARLGERLGRAIRVLACTHPAGPPICWCRKPLPGLALAFAHAHDVDLARSVHVGRSPADRGFARRAGMPFELVEAARADPAGSR